MSKLPQSGDINIHFDRIKCIDSLQKVEEGAIFVALGRGRLEKGIFDKEFN